MLFNYFITLSFYILLYFPIFNFIYLLLLFLQNPNFRHHSGEFVNPNCYFLCNCRIYFSKNLQFFEAFTALCNGGDLSHSIASFSEFNPNRSKLCFWVSSFQTKVSIFEVFMSGCNFFCAQTSVYCFWVR